MLMDLGPAIEYPVLEALACQEGVAPGTPAISTSPVSSLASCANAVLGPEARP